MPNRQIQIDPSRTRQAAEKEELSEYVEAFTRSSDRSRYAFYTVIVVTVLILIANWNIQPWSWPLLRLRTWFPDSVAIRTSTPPSQAAMATAADTFHNFLREEYARQFTARAVLTSSPLPGVSLDVNDIGTIGGLALILLMLVLALCMDREHENLYLAFFKVRQLAAAENADAEPLAESHGESAANLLYHALAMTQVLTSPPTLARWRNRGVLHRFGFIFFVPAIVYLWVVLSNIDTKGVAEAYHADVRRLLLIQFVMAAILWVLSGFTWVNSRAMAKRWKRMFFRVNPTRSHFEEMGWWQWLQLWPLREDESRLHQSVQKQLVDGVTIGAPRKRGVTSEVIARRSAVPDCVSRGLVDAVAKELEKEGKEAAEGWCEKHGYTSTTLLKFHMTKNEIVDDDWTVSGTWEFSYHEPISASSVSVAVPTGAVADDRKIP